MKTVRYTKENLTVAQQEELTANKYVLHCFNVLAFLFTLTFIFNLLDIFIIDKKLLLSGYLLSMTVYFLVFFISRHIPLYDRRAKYFILSSIIMDFTLISIFLTYHTVLLSILPFLYATLYSSKKVMRYVYFMVVCSTFAIVYGGYYF